MRPMTPCLGAVWVRRCVLHARAFIAGLSVQCLFRRACGRIEEKSYSSDVKRAHNHHVARRVDLCEIQEARVDNREEACLPGLITAEKKKAHEQGTLLEV